MRYRSYRSIFPLLFFDFPRLLKYYLYSIHSLFVWRECLAHQVPIVLTVLSFRFSGLCLMVVNATIHFHGQASPVGVWSFLRLPPNPSRGKKKKIAKFDQKVRGFSKMQELSGAFTEPSRSLHAALRTIPDRYQFHRSLHLASRPSFS